MAFNMITAITPRLIMARIMVDPFYFFCPAGVLPEDIAASVVVESRPRDKFAERIPWVTHRQFENFA